MNPQGQGDIDLLHSNTALTPSILRFADSDPQSPVPSYTFYARTTDNESRFKLVFALGD